MTTIKLSATRSPLTCVAVAGPLWAVVSLAQVATRKGFDLTEQPLSALSNGSSGWVQIVNFLLAGLLSVVGAASLGRALGSTWVPRLVRVYGVGMIAAGIFVMDPGPALTWRGYGHMAAGSISFIALIAACYVLGRHYSRAGDRRNAITSRVAGTALLVGDLWAMSGGRLGTVTLAVGAITAMLWISTVAAAHLR